MSLHHGGVLVEKSHTIHTFCHRHQSATKTSWNGFLKVSMVNITFGGILDIPYFIKFWYPSKFGMGWKKIQG